MTHDSLMVSSAPNILLWATVTQTTTGLLPPIPHWTRSNIMLTPHMYDKVDVFCCTLLQWWWSTSTWSRWNSVQLFTLIANLHIKATHRYTFVVRQIISHKTLSKGRQTQTHKPSRSYIQQLLIYKVTHNHYTFLEKNTREMNSLYTIYNITDVQTNTQPSNMLLESSYEVNLKGFLNKYILLVLLVVLLTAEPISSVIECCDFHFRYEIKNINDFN